MHKGPTKNEDILRNLSKLPKWRLFKYTHQETLHYQILKSQK